MSLSFIGWSHFSFVGMHKECLCSFDSPDQILYQTYISCDIFMDRDCVRFHPTYNKNICQVYKAVCILEV